MSAKLVSVEISQSCALLSNHTIIKLESKCDDSCLLNMLYLGLSILKKQKTKKTHLSTFIFQSHFFSFYQTSKAIMLTLKSIFSGTSN